MVAGIGNMFLQDDGFGGAVAKRLLNTAQREGVEVRDFGTGGLKLAYDLMKGYDALILLDASRRGDKPGTLYVLEPNEKEFDSELKEGIFIDPHAADPVTVLRFVKAMDAWPSKVVIIACEPESVDDFEIGLSKPVAAAVEDAMKLVETTIAEIFSEN